MKNENVLANNSSENSLANVAKGLNLYFAFSDKIRVLRRREDSASLAKTLNRV